MWETVLGSPGSNGDPEVKTTVRSKLGEGRSIDTMQVKIGRVVSEEIVDKHTYKQNSLYY